jgi:hypothetical protein
MLGLREQVVEGFKLVRLHWQYGDANDAKGQESVRAMGKNLTVINLSAASAIPRPANN